MQYDELTSFLNWYLTNRPLLPPADAPMYDYEGKLSAVLFRQYPFQVELFVEKPNIIIPEHNHPNVDSFEVFVCGEVLFHCNGQPMDTLESVSKVDPKTGAPALLGASIRVKPEAPHGATIGARGGTFLSVQKWMNDTPITSVGRDWRVTKDGSPVNSTVILFADELEVK